MVTSTILHPGVEGTAFFRLATLSVLCWLVWRFKKTFRSINYHQVGVELLSLNDRDTYC